MFSDNLFRHDIGNTLHCLVDSQGYAIAVNNPYTVVDGVEQESQSLFIQNFACVRRKNRIGQE